MLDRGLDDLQWRAADLVLSGWPITRIAEYLEVSRVSLYKWQKLPAWKRYVAEQTGEALQARSHRVRRVCELALETIERALLDHEIAPLKRAELALKWLGLIREFNQAAATAPATPEGRRLSVDVLRHIKEEIYGLSDPKLPNAVGK